MVFYYADGGIIDSQTYNMDASWILFETSPPYFTIVSSNCTQLWPNAKTKLQVSPLPRSTPVAGPTFDTPSTTVQPIPASAWRSHFGVNTHMGQGWDSGMVYDQVTYIGAGAIRDNLPSSSQAKDYARLAEAGVRLDFVAWGAGNKTALAAEIQAVSSFEKSQPGMLLYVEGFNEINNFGFTYDGIDPKRTYQGMAQAMTDLYSLVRNTSNLANVKVLDLTGGGYSDGAKFHLDDWEGHADLGTIHNYAFRGLPSVGPENSNSLFLVGLTQTYTNWQGPTSNYVVSEIGYHSSTFPDGVTEAAQAKLLVNTLLNGIWQGMKQLYLYELWDEKWAGYDGSESHFGLFRNDKTPKPVARALHFLSGLLQDSGSAPLGQQVISFQGLPVGTQYLLFQNSKKQFFAVLWNNSPVFNPNTKTDIVTATVQATLTLQTAASVSVYDIFSTTADDSKPLQPVKTVSSDKVSFSIGDTVVVLQF